MTGTEKQIAWAEKIKKEFADRFNSCYTNRAKGLEKEMYQKMLEYWFDKYTDATFWIEAWKRPYKADQYCELAVELSQDQELQEILTALKENYEKEEESTVTKYYYYETEDYNGTLVTDGKKAYDLPSVNGIDVMTAVDLTSPATPIELGLKYSLLIAGGKVYNFKQVREEFGDKLFDFCVDDYKRLYQLNTREDL